MDYVQHYLFADLDEIRQIFLQDNQLTFIHPKAFADNTQLARLFLHNNKLKSLDQEWFKKITDEENGSLTLEELYFDGNDLNCNCELHRFTSWAMENRKMRSLIQDMASKGNVPKCAGPQDLKGKEFYSVTTDDFSPCKEPQIIYAKKKVDKNSITFTCEASGEPAPSIHWFKRETLDGDQIELTSIDEAVYEQSHMVGRVFIPKAQKEDAGYYICVAQNTNGRVESQPERLDQAELETSLDMYPKADSPKQSPASPWSPDSPSSPDSLDKSKSAGYFDDISDSKFDYTKDKFDIEAIDENDDDDDDDYDGEDYDDYDDCPDECFCDFKYQRQWVDCRDAGINDITNVLETVPEDVNVLDLKDNDMDQIPDGAFVRFTDTLDTLHLDDNHDLGDSMGKEVFRGLFNLKQLTAKDIS